MAYVEVWKSGRLLTRRRVDEQKAQTGCRVRLGTAGEVRAALGRPEILGDFEVRVFEGEPPEARQRDQKTASIMPADAQTDSTTQAGRISKYTDIEGYKIIEPLGEGGMGMVWRAEQLSTRREVALKLLISHRVDSVKAQARFQREVELTARLDHPNIARIYDSGLHQGMYYYAMELIEGLPLDQYVKSRTFSRTEILSLMQKVCQGVLYAHLRAVIHRDLKPSNIIISPDGQPHILDFGLAKALLEEDESLMVSVEGQIAGTPAYMSPEQAAGHHSQLDTRTDVYSLGVILYELLTGQSPHDLSFSMFDLLRQIASGNIRRPRQVDKSIDSELEALLLKALAHNPEERYASAGALAKDIANYLDEEPLDAHVPTTFYFLRKKAFKYKKQVGIASAILVILFVTVIVTYTRIVGQRAVLRAAQERNKSLETELADLRTKILSGNKEEVEAALGVLEEKYLAAQRRAEGLQQKLERTIIPAGRVTSDAGFYFGNPVNLGEPINTPYRDAAPSFSVDGLEMYFCSTRDGGFGDKKTEDIWVARRATKQDPWESPVNLGATVNTFSKEFMSFLSADGLILLFASDRDGGYGRCDLYMIERATIDGPWSEPENLGPVINSETEDVDPTISSDGLVLYFSSNRDSGYGRGDIWITTRETRQNPWGPPVNLGSTINSTSQENMPFISTDGLKLLFVSDRPGGYGNRDIYISRRATIDQPWSEPVNLGPIVNRSAHDDLPFLSPDGSALYFNSRRPGGFGDFDIWKVSILPAIDFTFGKPERLGAGINTQYEDASPDISPDGLELYFHSNRPGGYGEADIWVVRRATTRDQWSEPENLGPVINTDADELISDISYDGLELYLLDWPAPRPGGYGNSDIWVSSRATTKDPWGPAVNLGPTLNSQADDCDASISADGLTLYFISNRGGEQQRIQDHDIFVTTRATRQDPWSAPVNLGAVVNSSYCDCRPSISADDLTLMFVSDRPGGFGDRDIYITRRTAVDQPWSEPINLGPTINSRWFDCSPCISQDGSTLFFESDRDGGLGLRDLWQAPVISVRQKSEKRPVRVLAGFAFGEPVNLGSVVNSPYYDDSPCFSADGLELYFYSERPGGYGNGDTWVTRRATMHNPWGEPVNLGPQFNSAEGADSAPAISHDGLEMYLMDYEHQRPGGRGGSDLWVARRTKISDPWESPLNLGPPVNSPFHEANPSISYDGLTLYFDSDRTGGYGNFDIWVTTRVTKQSPWRETVNLGPTINTATYDAEPFISNDGLVLLFTSSRAGSYGTYDMFITRRTTTDQPWLEPVNLGSIVNSSGPEENPTISPDGSALLFEAERPGGFGGRDIWLAPIIPLVDFNDDGKVDINDLEIFIRYWDSDEPRFDIAPLPFGDGRVDEQDLKLLVDYWGLRGIDPTLLEYLAQKGTQEVICIEAEAADTITAPMKIFSDRPDASGSLYIGTDDEIGGALGKPPDSGIASYNFSVTGGIYKILFRVIVVGDNDSFWVRIPGAMNYDPGTHDSGWIMYNLIQQGTFWHWDEVQSTTHDNQVVNVTLQAGQHELQIAYREDGTLLDTIVITRIE